MQVAEISPHNKCTNLLAGISAVVGLIGGVYMLTSGAKTIINKICEGRFSKNEPVIDNICVVCSRPINIIDFQSFITCCVCNKRICKDAKCSNLLPTSDRSECQLCHSTKDSVTHTQSWIAEQMFFRRQKYVYNPMRARSEIYIPIRNYNEDSTNFERVSQAELNTSVIVQNQKDKIREYAEEVMVTLLGDSLSQKLVTPLSKSENYLPGIINNDVHQHSVGLNGNQTNENILTKFPEISQTRLRHIVESIITEMLGTQNLSNVNESEVDLKSHLCGNGRPHNCHYHHYLEPKVYQNFLTTAVLNKITQKEKYYGKFSESTPDLSSSNIDVNLNMEDQSTSSDRSLGATFSYVDAERSPKIIKDLDHESTLNDYIASHTVPLPDLSNAMTESEDDDNASISSSILVEGNWEDNWLFKKKRPSVTTSMTGSIGMLIPAPKDDVRAQIGDKTTDEISDLSEMDSDTDDSSVKIYSSLDPFSGRILNKHLIGGQNTKVILDELIEKPNFISNTSQPPNEASYIETMNEHVVEVVPKAEAFISTVSSNSSQELEINLTSKPNCCYEVLLTPENENNLLSGSIAEREYKKWNNAVEMPNNPYSPEALKRRISGSQERFIDLPNISSNTNKKVITITETTKTEDNAHNENLSDIGYKRYSRDYYINTDHSSKVSPKHQNHRNDRRKRLSSDCNDELMADSVRKENISQGNETITIEDPTHPTVFLALPAQVVEENTSFETPSNQSIQSVNTTTCNDSDTDFVKQTTVNVHNEGELLTADSVEYFQATAPKFAPEKYTFAISEKSSEGKISCHKALSLETTAASPCVSTPNLGSTPNAFKFLQPKRRLIDPSQMLPSNEETHLLSCGEKPVVEEEVAQIMPSVKALAQVFLLSSNKCSQAEKRWKKGIQRMPYTSVKFNDSSETYMQHIVKATENNENTTISSNVSSLESDPAINMDILINKPATSSSPEHTASNEENNNKNTTNMLRRVSMLKSNIAFFENLKFK